MIQNEKGKLLHDKASRGEKLTDAESHDLKEWYAMQDALEEKQLGVFTADETLSILRAQIDTALTQLLTVTQRIQEIAVQNEVLREEIATLRRQATHFLSLQSA